MTRPFVGFERHQAAIKAVLNEALTADLAPLKRSDLTLMRVDLDATKRLQQFVGQVAPWDDWRAAFARVDAEIATRPPSTRKRRWEK